MAAIGIDGVHKVIGYFCDLCGKECEGDKEELNALGKSRSCVALAPSHRCNNQLKFAATQQRLLCPIGCTYPGCEAEASVYHQDCIEKYLKSIRCEK